MSDNLFDGAEFGDKFLSRHGAIFIYVDKRNRYVPREGKYYDVLYFIQPGNCLDINEYGSFVGIEYITYDTYLKEFDSKYNELVSRYVKQDTDENSEL